MAKTTPTPHTLKPGIWWALVRSPTSLPVIFASRRDARVNRDDDESEPIKVIVRMAPTEPAWKRNRARIQRQALEDLGGVRKGRR